MLTDEFKNCVGRLSAELYRSDADQLDLALAELSRLYRLARHYRELSGRQHPEPGSCAHLCRGGGPTTD